MKIFVYKKFDLKSGNRKYPCSNIWRLEWDKYTKFGMNISNKTLLNVAKSYVYSFYRFWIIKEKPARGKNALRTKIMVKGYVLSSFRQNR